MSASRYIIRSEGNFDIEDLGYAGRKIKRESIKNKIVDVILDEDLEFSRVLRKFGKAEIKSKSHHKFVDMIRELIPYANIINYKSFIIILCEKVEPEKSICGSVTCVCDSVENIDIDIDDYFNYSYDIVIRQPKIEVLRDYYDDDIYYDEDDCDEDDCEYIHPQCALLFDKNNYCRKIDLSDNTLKLMTKHSLWTNNDYNMFPVGYYVWKADFLFDDTDNTLYGSKFLGSEISFFSVNKPSFKALRLGIRNMFPPECEEWLNNNIKHIREDLHLNGNPERTKPKPKYEYINNADNEYINKLK